jgi:DDE superfamily endonuclease
MQRLLASAVVDDSGLRDDLRRYVAAHLGDPAAVLIVDETGDVKKGTATVGVQRQYSGTAGRIENSQVAVCLVCAAARGYAFIDRELCLPRSWARDQGRCGGAGVPGDVGFAVRYSRTARATRPWAGCGPRVHVAPRSKPLVRGADAERSGGFAAHAQSCGGACHAIERTPWSDEHSAPRRHQPRGPQPAQVVGHQGLRVAGQAGQLADLAVTASQLAQQPPPHRVPHQL